MQPVMTCFETHERPVGAINAGGRVQRVKIRDFPGRGCRA